MGESYRKGELSTGELKKMTIKLLQEYVKGFQDRRKDVTDEILRQYMTPRKLEWKGNPNPKPKESKPKESKVSKDVKQVKSRRKQNGEEQQGK